MTIFQPSPSLPLISVIIPAHNAEAFIERTLDSVLTQTYKNIEVLVVDDGSQDKTVEIVRSVAQRDPRVIFLQQSNAGVAAARNTAIRASRGEFIAPIDADDIWYPRNLEKQVQCMLQSPPSVGFVYSWSLEIDEQGALSGGFHASQHHGEAFLKLVNQFFIGNASSTLIRRICLEEVGGYNCNLRAQGAQGCEDWDLYLRIAERYHISVVPEFLVGYRQITNSMSRNYTSMAKSQALVLRALRSKHPELMPAVYRWSTSRFCLYLAHRSNRDQDFAGVLTWLSQSLKLDPSMMLIRHDLYILLAQVWLRQLMGHSIKAGAEKHRHSLDEKVSLDRINRMIRIREFLPSTLYDKVRLKVLSFQNSYIDLEKLNLQDPLLELLKQKAE